MDLDKLIQPIPSSSGGCGEDLLFSSEFDEIQEARRFDDPSLSQGEWVTEIKEADWPGVVRLCESVLANKSKDLRIAAWFTEARCKLDGFRGLAEGYELLNRLAENYWSEIHPLPEDGDFEQRIGILDWLSNQTSRLIREVPLSFSHKGNFSLQDQESARATAKNIERNPGQAEEIAREAHVTLETFEAAVKDTPKRFFLDELESVERLKNAMKSLQGILDSRMGDQAPAFGASFDILDDAYRFLQRNAGETSSSTPQANAHATQQLPSGSTASTANKHMEPTMGGNHHASISSGPVQSRAQAIQQLHEIAEFFRRTEPHSPVAYLAEKAAKWGSMSLHEWLRTVVKDDGALLRMEELLGVEQQNDTSY